MPHVLISGHIPVDRLQPNCLKLSFACNNILFFLKVNNSIIPLGVLTNQNVLHKEGQAFFVHCFLFLSLSVVVSS